MAIPLTANQTSCAESPVGVTKRRTQREHNESAFPPKAAVKADMRI